MDESGDHLFPCAAFALDQNRYVSTGHFLDFLPDRPHDFRLTEDQSLRQNTDTCFWFHLLRVGARRTAHKFRPVQQKHHFASPMLHILAHLNPSESSARGLPRVTDLLLSLVFLSSYIKPEGHVRSFPFRQKGKNEGQKENLFTYRRSFFLRYLRYAKQLNSARSRRRFRLGKIEV